MKKLNEAGLTGKILMTAKMSKQESLFDLMQQAKAMLLDRSKEEQDLIYHCAKFDHESRAAIILAYQSLYKKEWDDEGLDEQVD